MKSSLFSRALTAAAFVGGLASLSAQPVTTSTSGLVGTTYAGVSYGFIDFDNSEIDVHALKLDLNNNFGPNFDGFISYEHDRSEKFTDGRVTQNLVAIGTRAFVNWNSKFKPYAEGGVGWEWFRAPYGVRENSFLWLVGVGIEIGTGSRWTAAPFVRYYDLRDSNNSHNWNYGLRGSYWLNERVGIQLTGTRDDDHNMEYAVGLNYRM